MEKVKKKKKWISYTISSIFLILAAYITISSVVSVSKKEPPSVFGHSFFIVATKSMEPEINTGDFVISRKVSFQSIKKGDVINFTCIDKSLAAYGYTITHKVERINYDVANPKIIISVITKGVNNPDEDDMPVTKANFLGKIVSVSPSTGKFITKITGNKKVFIFLLVAVLLLFIMMIEVKNILKIRNEIRNEKLIEAEKQKIKAEILNEYNNKQGDND